MNGPRILIGCCLSLLFCNPVPAAAPDSKAVNKASRLSRTGDRNLASGNVDRARESYEKALATLPGFPSAHIGMGNIEMAGGSFEAALEQYSEAEKGFGMYGAALMQTRMRRYADAQKQAAGYRDMIQQLDQSPSPPARAEMMKSQMEAKIRQLEAIEPPNVEKAAEPPGEVYYHIGNALFQLGRKLEAIESWERCRRLQPGFAMVHHNLAIGYWQMGRLEQAQESLERAEKLGFKVSSEIKNDLEKALEASRPRRTS